MAFVQKLIEPFKGLSRPVWILALAMLVNRIGSMLIVFMSLYFTQELKLSLSDSALLIGAFGIGSIAGSYLGGWLTDRIGYYKVILFALFGSGVMMIPILLTDNFFLLAVFIFMFSTVSDCYRPANIVATSHYAGDSARTRAISLMRIAVNLGFGVGPAIGGLGAFYFGYTPLFIFDACTSIGAGIVIMLMLQDDALVSAKKKITDKIAGDNVFKDFEYLAFILMVIIYGTLFFQIMASIPVYLKSDLGFREDTIGYLLGLNGLLVVIMEMPIVNHVQNKYSRSTLIAVGCIMMAVAFLCICFQYKSLLLCLGYIFFITLSEIFAMPFMMNYALAKPIAERKGEYVAVYSGAYGLAHILAPYTGLNLADRMGFSYFYIITFAFSILLGIFFYGNKRVNI